MKGLETERLILRPFRLEDRDEIHRLVYADSRVAPGWTGRTWPLDEITKSFARKLAQRSNGLDFQAIVLKATREMIGLIGFQLYEEGEIEQYMTFEHEASRRAYDPEFFEVEITYALGYAFWHKGYATEAGRAIIEHGFRALNIGRIVNSVAEENVHSVKLMKRLGLRIERSLKPKPFIGPWQNSAGVIGILENPDWQRRKESA
ncbi:MAG: GNAT family N-acetyltransferase [Caldilineaceae bacterium]